MKPTLTLFSPAKINFFLRVLNKRSDGYHSIASLMQTIDLSDILYFTRSDEDQLTCSDPSISCDSSNLVSKAVELFRKKTGLKFKLKIHIKKNIAPQAGLAGGSSNAATTLWALNALSYYTVSEKTLQQWSSEIGSDIPFFFSFGTAYCTGKGELVKNLPPLPISQLYTLFKPVETLPTPLIYKELNLKTTSCHDPEQLLDKFYSGDPYYVNDLEEPSFRICPSLKKLKERLLDRGFKHIFMTGSGTGLICEGNDEQGTAFHLLTRCASTWYSPNPCPIPI